MLIAAMMSAAVQRAARSAQARMSMPSMPSVPLMRLSPSFASRQTGVIPARSSATAPATLSP